MTRAAKPQPQLAFLTIGHSHFLLEATKAMKVAELMQHAAEADWTYDDGRRYTIGEPAQVEFRMVRASEVRMPEGQAVPVPAKPRLLK